MKKLLLVGAVALFGAMSAQTEKGSWVVGGSTTLGFNNVSNKTKVGSESYDGAKVSTFGFTPSVGYFVANNIAVGLDLGFMTTTTKEDDEKLTQSVVKIMPTGTYYFKSDSKVLPYLGVGVGYGSLSTKYENVKTTYDGFAWKAKGGIVYLITPSIGLDLGVAYDQFSNKESYEGMEFKNNVNTFGVNAGISVFLK